MARLGDYQVSRDGSRLRISRNGDALWTTMAAPATLAETRLVTEEHRALHQ